MRAKHLLIIGYSLATLAVLFGEYNAIARSHNFITHLIWIGLTIWNIFVVAGFLKRRVYARNMIFISSYFQLLVVLIGGIAYVTGMGYSVELNNKDVTLLDSMIITVWAVFKLLVTNRHYANT